jgi:hypothetical protein
VREVGGSVPGAFELAQNYPNPFNPSTTIRFSVPAASIVTLKVFNLIGQEVATLVDETVRAGNYETRFDAAELSSGVYIYQLTSGGYSRTRRMLLVK